MSDEIKTYDTYELGEEGEQWMVEGTTDQTTAIAAVAALWQEQGVADDYWDHRDDLVTQSRTDWYWEAVNPDQPDDETILRNVTEHGYPEHGTGDIFVGVLVTL